MIRTIYRITSNFFCGILTWCAWFSRCVRVYELRRSNSFLCHRRRAGKTKEYKIYGRTYRMTTSHDWLLCAQRARSAATTVLESAYFAVQSRHACILTASSIPHRTIAPYYRTNNDEGTRRGVVWRCDGPNGIHMKLQLDGLLAVKIMRVGGYYFLWYAVLTWRR